MTSIRARLQRRLLRLIAAVFVPASLLIVIAVALEYAESFHGRTAHTAQLMLAFASTQPTPDTALTHIAENPDLAFDTDDYVVVISRGGRLIYASDAFPPEALLALPMAGSVHIGGTKWIANGFEDDRTDTRVIICVDAWEPLMSSLQVAGLVALYVILATAAVGCALVVGVRTGLMPLDAFADEVRGRSEDHLAPLDEAQAPAELQGVAHALNGLMARLRLVLDRERDFVSNAAHELRTPLTAIRAQVEALDGDLSPRARPRFANILVATDRAARLVAQLLDVARSQAVDLSQRPGSPIDLVELVQSMVAEQVPAANERGVEIALDSPPSLTAMAYPELLTIVLRNLVENAVKYAASPGQVVVTVNAAPEGAVTVVVEDDGPGLSAEAFERAFDRFQRLGLSDGEGVGLGLSIVAELCQRMGVPVDRLEPNALGGLRVRLRLPAAPVPAPPDLRTTFYG